MDEVDLILHPMKSELNFPVGHKQELDLSPQRWQMPIHLLDGVFYAERGRMAVGFKQVLYLRFLTLHGCFHHSPSMSKLVLYSVQHLSTCTIYLFDCIYIYMCSCVTCCWNERMNE